MDEKVFVSEAEIAYWGSVFPSGEIQAKEIIYGTFLNKRVEVYVYDFPRINDYLHFRSIEQNLSIGVNEELTREALNRPVRLGYRMAAYQALGGGGANVLRYAHSALQFARCFKRPPRLRDGNDSGGNLMKIHSMHAERLQHMSGVRNISSKELKKRLCDRRIYGVTFGHFVLQACRKGIFSMPVEALRMWLAGSFDMESVTDFMNTYGYQVGCKLCIFCHVKVTRPALCTVKLGSRWAEVQIRVHQENQH